MLIDYKNMQFWETRITFFRSYDFSGVEMRIFLHNRKDRKTFVVTGFEVEDVVAPALAEAVGRGRAGSAKYNLMVVKD